MRYSRIALFTFATIFFIGLSIYLVRDVCDIYAYLEKFLQDNRLLLSQSAMCHMSSPELPKGVCVPGGACMN